MRKNFLEILQQPKINLKDEYCRLYDMLYGKRDVYDLSLYEVINENFHKFWFAGTCFTLQEFEKSRDINFNDMPQNFDIDCVVNFGEYLYNLINVSNTMDEIKSKFNTKFIMNHILKLMDFLQHEPIMQENVTIFVPKRVEADFVSKKVTKNLSNEILRYNHYSLKGNLDEKKSILLKIYFELETQKNLLIKIDSNLKTQLFCGFNNFNIRHNNSDSKIHNFKQQFENLTTEEKEEMYDCLYSFSLIAFIKLENRNRKKKFDEIKEKIDKKKV